jgi:predicted nucleic acid-binding protein
MSEEPEGEELVQLFQERYNQVFLTSVSAIPATSEDPADNKFIECVVAADAKYIISGDRHPDTLADGFSGGESMRVETMAAEAQNILGARVFRALFCAAEKRSPVL